MDQRIINLFDEYTHKPLKRDEFVKRLANLTGSMASALAVLPLLEINYVQAETVAHQDDRIKTESITFPDSDNYERLSGPAWIGLDWPGQRQRVTIRRW